MKQDNPENSSNSYSVFSSISKPLRKISLKSRLISAFIILAVIPLLVVSAISMRTYSNSIRNKLTEVSLQSIQIADNSINTLLSKYSDSISSLSVSADIQKYLREYTENADPYARYRLAGVLYDAYSPVSGLSLSSDVCTVTADGKYASYLQGAVLIDKDQMSTILAGADAASPKDYIHLLKSQKGELLISMTRKVYDKKLSGKHIGYICVFFNAYQFSSSTFSTTFLGEGVNLMLSDATGCVLASQEPKQIGTSLPYFEDFGYPTSEQVINTSNGNTIVTQHNSVYNIYTVAVIPDSYISSEINKVRTLVYSITFSLIIITLFLILLICKTITDPISKIISIYQSEGNSLPSGRVHDNSSDELGYLSRTIDTMADQNQLMLTRLHDSDKKKRELELEMLSYQINPHFLFNTLNSLKWIAVLNNIPTLSEGIGSLSSLLESTLIDKDEFITLGREIEILKYYCNLQSLRYIGRFEIEYDINPECLESKIPRFILQPLVENSILHGIHEEDDMVHIMVIADYRNSGILIRVIDDGSGFVVSSIVDNKTGSFNGIGLSNVDSRLRLYFGKESRLIIDSTPGVGTECRIYIPANTNQDGDKNV